jgi:hypothetical protein
LLFGSGFGKSFLRVLACLCQRRDRQPATGVVVMPVRMMAAIGAKHRLGLIPECRQYCQTLDGSSVERVIFILKNLVNPV